MTKKTPTPPRAKASREAAACGKLEEIFQRLFAFFGPQHWWPGETPFEVAVGAILTQNTNWGNVEKAIANLKREGALDPASIHEMPVARLASLIRPSGYFNVKARRLKAFMDFLMDGHSGSMGRMKRRSAASLRESLLAVDGIGPETADSIILYALGKPVFVIDAYTRRVLSRHGLMDHGEPYGRFQEAFHSCYGTGGNAAFFNEYHALFVAVGKRFCRRRPLCAACPLNGV